MSGPPRTPGEIARWACMLEVLARKPGNVNRYHDHDDCHLIDFLLSASAIVGPMETARQEGVGAAVLKAVHATQSVCRTNTNLGMILLLAPLAARRNKGRPGVQEVLANLTQEDARDVYEAIRLTRPGGLGRATRQDVEKPPTVGLIEAMNLAQDRDLVARQYVNGYADVFNTVLGALKESIAEGRSLEVAIVRSYLEMMAQVPDTLIARKKGQAIAKESSARAREVLNAGWPDAQESARMFEEFDLWLRADGHARNPGTTADLVCAGLFEAIADGTIQVPLDWTRAFPERLNS